MFSIERTLIIFMHSSRSIGVVIIYSIAAVHCASDFLMRLLCIYNFFLFSQLLGYNILYLTSIGRKLLTLKHIATVSLLTKEGIRKREKFWSSRLFVRTVVAIAFSG